MRAHITKTRPLCQARAKPASDLVNNDETPLTCRDALISRAHMYRTYGIRATQEQLPRMRSSDAGYFYAYTDVGKGREHKCKDARR